MSDSVSTKNEVIDSDTPLQEVDETENSKQKVVNLEDLKIAYVVGLDEKGDFLFEVYGKDKGLVELLGVHHHATRYINRLYDNNQISGDRLTSEVGRITASLSEKLDKILAVISPKKPDNKL